MWMMRSIRVAYHTLGCKVNQYETETIRARLEAAGFVTVSIGSGADVCVVNTCTVTNTADAKSRSALRRALRLSPGAFVVATGCYADLEPGRIGRIEGVDLVVANRDKDTIPERIIARFGGSRLAPSQCARPRLRTRAVVKVQDGCDQFCSYCVVPFARSPKTSRPLEDVLSEVASLAGFGYKEAVLAGIRLGSYEDRGSRLPDLMRAVSELNGITRIRLDSIEPWEVDDALLEAFESPKVCRHLHIPLQSGDDEILRRMNRPYTAAGYAKIVSKVREAFHGIGITTDVIAGFPGETDEMFEATCALIRETDFSRLHVFRYSPRKGTKAASLPDQIPEKVKKLRSEKLMELGEAAMRRFAASLVGKTVDVLIEGAESREQGAESPEPSCPAPNVLTGLTDNYVQVRLTGDVSLRGKVARVKVTRLDPDGGAIGTLAVSRQSPSRELTVDS